MANKPRNATSAAYHYPQLKVPQASRAIVATVAVLRLTLSATRKTAAFNVLFYFDWAFALSFP